jgi:hypothetical protein
MVKMKDIYQVLSTDLFKKLINNEIIQIAQLNAIIALLIKGNIPFDLSFSPGTQKDAPQAELAININPTTTITFVITFDSRVPLFKPSAP